MLRRLRVVLARCLLASSLAEGVSAQSRMDRDWDNDRGWQDRDWSRDQVRDWHRAPRWHDRDCYYERRRERNRFGEIVIRRHRICED